MWLNNYIILCEIRVKDNVLLTSKCTFTTSDTSQTAHSLFSHMPGPRLTTVPPAVCSTKKILLVGLMHCEGSGKDIIPLKHYVVVECVCWFVNDKKNNGTLNAIKMISNTRLNFHKIIVFKVFSISSDYPKLFKITIKML